jgi:hypothetical protein
VEYLVSNITRGKLKSSSNVGVSELFKFKV